MLENVKPCLTRNNVKSFILSNCIELVFFLGGGGGSASKVEAEDWKQKMVAKLNSFFFGSTEPSGLYLYLDYGKNSEQQMFSFW